MADASISEDDFQKFREFFYRKTGIQFDNTKRYFVDKRLLERINLLNECIRLHLSKADLGYSGDGSR